MALFQEWEGLFDIERKGCKLINNDHVRNLCVTMVGLMDVPDSGQGDYRRRRAFDTSSCMRVSFRDTFLGYRNVFHKAINMLYESL